MDWQQIYQHLQDGGFDVYALGQHQGRCTAPYIVLRNNGCTRPGALELGLYELLLYCPVDQYSRFEKFIQAVQARMNQLFPAAKLVDGPGIHYLDPDVLGYMTSLTYQCPRVTHLNEITYGKE